MEGHCYSLSLCGVLSIFLFTVLLEPGTAGELRMHPKLYQ